MRNTNIKVGKKKKRKGFATFLIIMLLLLGAAYGVYEYKFKDNKSKNVANNVVVIKPVVVPVPEPKLQIFTGDNRPVAVMIDNELGAWPQTGIQDAYMVYELIIEGGQTRMMAIFKDKSPAKVGPIRSSRHYFVEYAMEHGAIYTHFGWSPKAKATIESNHVNNINGMYYGGKSGNFWREGVGYHTAFTSLKNIRALSASNKYLTTSTADPIYNYSIKEYNLEGAKEVESIKLTYSYSHNTSYIYDAEKKVFMRSMRGKKHTDRVTKEQFFAKNIVVMQVKNYTMGTSGDKGRQELENKGTGKGYYLTNGRVINITWKKENAKAKTYFYDLTGTEITLNDGITFVQVVPTGNSISIKYKPEPVPVTTTGEVTVTP